MAILAIFRIFLVLFVTSYCFAFVGYRSNSHARVLKELLSIYFRKISQN